MRGPLIFEQLGIIGLVAALIARLAGVEVHYVSLSRALADDRIAAWLGTIGLQAASHENKFAAEESFNRMLRGATDIAFGGLIEDSAIYAVMAGAVADNSAMRRKYRIAVKHHVQRMILPTVETIWFARQMARDRRFSRVCIAAPWNSFTRRLADEERSQGYGIVRVPLPNIRGLAAFWGRAGRLFRRAAGDISRRPAARGASVEEAQPSTDEIHALFFPHQGIHYGKLFVKDQFYDADAQGYFSPRHIMHVSLGEPGSILARSIDYYLQHGIPYCDIGALARMRPVDWVLNYLRLLHRGGVSVAGELLTCGTGRLALFFHLYSLYSYYLDAIDRLPKVKLAFIGYDILLPKPLALALAAKNIATVAAQERLIGVFHGVHYPIVDYYAVLGQKTCDFIANNPELAAIGECWPIGPVRLDLIKEAMCAAHPRKYIDKKRSHFVVLAMDWWSERCAVANRRQLTSNWETNKRFYRDMVRLAREIPRLFIIIKGKESETEAIPALREEMAEIAKTPNVVLETDLDEHTPERMVAIADMGIALHTSLGDEMLAAGKPVLFYDYCGYPSAQGIYDGFDIVVKSYEELAGRTASIAAGDEFLPEGQFAVLREYYYSQPGTTTVRARLHDRLSELVLKIDASEAPAVTTRACREAGSVADTATMES